MSMPQGVRAQGSRFARPRSATTLCALALLGLFAGSLGSAADKPVSAGADELAFSIRNMDPDISPREDFYRFAAGGWLTRVPRPQDRASYSFPVIQGKIINDQLQTLVDSAVNSAASAPKGSSRQLVGDFYKAYMNLDRRRARGMTPLAGEFAKIDGLTSKGDLTRFLVHEAKSNGLNLLVGFGPSPALTDSSRYAIFGATGSTALKEERDVYRAEDSAPRRLAYRAYVHDLLQVAGYDETEAARVTQLVLDFETELDKAKLTRAQARDFNRLNNRMSLADAQALIPQVDITAYLTAMGIPVPDEIIVTEPAYFKAVSAIIDARPLGDIKDYARFRLIEQFSGVLSPAFDEPKRALNQAFTGVATLRPINERAIAELKGALGQPFSQLYVETYYDEVTRRRTLELISYIMAAMEQRIPTRTWLSPETKAEAMAKLKAFENKVGYPEQWIDYSGVTIVPDDPVANARAIMAFGLERELSKLGGPVRNDDFNQKSTLPIAMNAAYAFFDNGFQITAAISQAPAFEPDADPAVRFCRFGAIIGHETTHGFDSIGRQFDAKGNLRDWWTKADAAAFTAEAQKLIDQTSSTPLVPGHANDGTLWVGENMADVGGIKLAYTALMDYLRAHPNEDREIDGYSQAQRCFIAWAQMWAENATTEYLINIAESGDHPPSLYRTIAPLQHFDAWYEAFGIREGDPMWLAPEERVNTW